MFIYSYFSALILKIAEAASKGAIVLMEFFDVPLSP